MDIVDVEFARNVHGPKKTCEDCLVDQTLQVTLEELQLARDVALTLDAQLQVALDENRRLSALLNEPGLRPET